MRRGVSALAWYERGCALERGDVAAARRAYERALAGRPDLADACNNLGRLQHDAGELAVAEGSYRLAICAAGDAAIALYWFNVGVAVEDRGADADAIAAYQAAIARDATLADAHFNLARLLERLGRAQLGHAQAGGELMMRRAVRHLCRYRELVGGSRSTSTRR